MSPFKKFFYHSYYHGTAPCRLFKSALSARAGRAPAILPIYHRVADDEANEWTTATDDFVRGIRWLKANYELVSLEEVQRRIRGNRMDRPCVSITFDDGYAENCHVALPLLIEEKIPCTYFVSSNPVLKGDFFQHDLKMGNRFVPNTINELRAIAEAGIEIGAYMRTHADMGSVTDPAELYDELVASRQELEDALGSPVRYFAFPFGQIKNLSASACELAEQAGFLGVCSAYGGYNYAGDDAFHLQRRGIDGPLIRVKNWVWQDPLRSNPPVRWTWKSEEALERASL